MVLDSSSVEIISLRFRTGRRPSGRLPEIKRDVAPGNRNRPRFQLFILMFGVMPIGLGIYGFRFLRWLQISRYGKLGFISMF